MVLAKGCCKTPVFWSGVRRLGIRGASVLLRRFCAAGLADILTVNQDTHGAPWWTSGVPPRWTDIRCAPERQVDGKRFQRFGTSGMESQESKGSDGRNSGPGRCRFPPQSHRSSLIGGARIVIHGGLRTQAQQQIHHYPTGQGPTQPLLYRESASRALRKLRSLFNSASSRKHSCISCQAATPCRVACCAPLGT